MLVCASADRPDFGGVKLSGRKTRGTEADAREWARARTHGECHQVDRGSEQDSSELEKEALGADGRRIDRLLGVSKEDVLRDD